MIYIALQMIKDINIDLMSMSLFDITINQLLCLIKVYFISKKQKFEYKLIQEDLNYLRLNKYILLYTDKNINYIIREKGRAILKQVVDFKLGVSLSEKKKKSDIHSNPEYITKVNMFRNKFKDLRTGSMGNLKSVSAKLNRWSIDNPNVSFETILKAIDLYLESLNGDYRFLQRADYFIYKQNNHREEESRLSIYVEEVLKEPSNSDWTSNIT